MGFDLNSRKTSLGEKGYYRAGIYDMILLRGAMIAAGVDPKLVYQKFVANDGFRVTASESRLIASSLLNWLTRSRLAVDLSERNPRAKAANKGYLQILAALGDRADKKIARHFASAKSIPVNLDKGMRKAIREFADFCNGSGGFTVT